MTQQIVVPTTDGAMPAHLWLPESGSGPGILLLQEIFGVSAYIQRRAVALAEDGYVVLAPVLYWRLDRQDADDVSGPEAVEQAMALASRLDPDQAVADAVAAFDALAARGDVIGTPANLGFCMGGSLGFASAARAEPAALVSYYGTKLPEMLDLARQVTCPSLHHFGTADDYLSMDEIRAISEAVTAEGRPAQIELYDGANHAFDNDDFSLHHPEASRRAWATTLDFLRRHTTGTRAS
jgi:carboxymethylenebutenolidase